MHRSQQTTRHICLITDFWIEMQTLVEVAQSFDDGRRRVRNLPLSEKLKPSEDPCVAAERGIREELGGHIGPETVITVDIDPEHPCCEHSQSVSKSYPGLLSNVRSHPARRSSATRVHCLASCVPQSTQCACFYTSEIDSCLFVVLLDCFQGCACKWLKGSVDCR